MKKSLPILILLAAILVLPVRAQHVATFSATSDNADGKHYTLTLEPGRILLNGKEIPKENLPESLDLNGIHSTLNLSGNSLIEINGTAFQLVDGSIVEVDPETSAMHNVMVYVNASSDNDQVFHIVNRGPAAPVFMKKREGPYDVVMKNYVGKLNEKAVEFEKIRSRMEFEVQSQEQDMQFALQLRANAENAARIAGSFPRIEYEGYLMGIRDKDTHLYDGLVREQEMELHTHQLASEARAAATPAERDKFVTELRAQLNEIFELKQKNREDEINQLDQRLQELTALMNKRAELQDKIIEKRLKELLGELDW